MIKSKAQLEEERLRLYISDKQNFDKSIVIATGGLLALIDHIEEANNVAPNVFTNQLKYTIEDFLNSLYNGKVEKGVSDQHNDVAEVFRKFIDNLKFV
jgi:hypothetical protein